MLRVCSLIALWLACATAGALANGATLATGSAGTTRWEVTSPLSFVPVAGYFPLAVTATNPSGNTVRVNYRIQSVDYYLGPSGTSTVAAGSFEIQPAKSSTATHWVWRGSNFQRSYNQSYLRISVNTPSGDSEDTLKGPDRDAGSSMAFSRRVFALNPQGLIARRSDIFQWTPRGEEVVVFDPATLPADWRVFSSLYAVFLTPTDWDELSPGVRDALRTWIGFGGSVALVGDDRADTERVRKELSPDDLRLGMFGHSRSVSSVSPDNLAGLITHLAPRRVVFAVGAASPEFDRYGRGRRSYSRYRDGTNPYQKFPLRDAFGRRDIPYLVICLLLIVFAVVVGPISLQLWAKAGKRHRLFLTTPIFSIATSGLLLIVMLFQDGLGIDGRRFTIIDLAPAGSSQPSALIYQEQFSRAGMVGGGGFPIEPGLMPIIPIDSMERSLAVLEDQAVGSWISSRRDSSLSLAGSLPIRWQVTHAGASEDSLSLRIECPITEFSDAWFVDGDGLVWKWDTNPIDKTGKMRFIPASREPESMMRPMFKRFSANLQGFVLSRLDERQQRNRFWALAKDGAAGARATHEKIDWLESGLIITSKVDPKT